MPERDPDPAILELARAIARGMARDDYAKGIRWIDGQPVQRQSAELEDRSPTGKVPEK